ARTSRFCAFVSFLIGFPFIGREIGNVNTFVRTDRRKLLCTETLYRFLYTNFLHKFLCTEILLKFFVGEFFGGGFGSWFALVAGEGVFHHFGDAAVASFGSAAIEDAEQLVASLQRSHGLPALVGARIAGESPLEDGRQVELGFHGGEQLFGDSLGAADAGFGTLYGDDPIANPFAHGKAECVEPAAEPAVFFEDALEFGGDDGDAFCSVRFEAEVGGVADGDVAAGLQTLFDDHALVALAGGEDPSAKREAVDFAFDADFGARSPGFSDVERDADKNKVEA